MRKLWVIIAAVVGIAVVGFLVDFGHGRALDTGGGSFEIGVPIAVGKPTDVYYLVPTPTNRSGNPITLVAVEPDHLDPGLEFVDARVYQVGDFPGSTPTLGWTAELGSPGSSPSKVSSVPVKGYSLPARASMEKQVVLAQFRVTGNQRPLQASGLRLTYRNGFRDHTQTLPCTYTVTTPVTR